MKQETEKCKLYSKQQGWHTETKMTRKKKRSNVLPNGDGSKEGTNQHAIATLESIKLPTTDQSTRARVIHNEKR